MSKPNGNSVPDNVKEAFKQSQAYFPTPIQELQYYNKYARWNWELQRRETWVETVDRVSDFLKELSENRLTDEEYEEIRLGVLNMEAMPSMRLIAMAGPAARRNNACIYNCSYQAFDSVESLVEALHVSMSGCGVGYSVEKKFVEKVPTVEVQTYKHREVFIVPDSQEGWGNALEKGLSAWMAGEDIGFDYSLVRPAGAVLKTKGGRACLTGDTVLYKDRKKSYQENTITIKGLYEKRIKSIKKIKIIKLRCLDEKTGIITRNSILDVVDNGIQSVFKIVTERGYTIKATQNHRFLNKFNKYAEVALFSEGDLIGVNGERKTNNCKKCSKLISRRATQCKVCFDLSQQSNSCNLRTARQRKQCRRYSKKMSFCEWCGESKTRLVVHHIDEDPLNNDWSNLVKVCEPCHRKYHTIKQTFGNPYSHRFLSFDRIVKIKQVQEERVYDLQMLAPNHNFVANGFISHNSGPEPLRQMLDFCRDTIMRASGRKLTTLECHDMMCEVGNAAVSGGVRRTAMISLFSWDDEEMRSCKDGTDVPIRRWNSNNSVVWPDRQMTHEEISDQMNTMMNAGRGEPGIFNRSAAIENSPPRRKFYGDPGTNPCYAKGTLVHTRNGHFQIEDLIGKEVEIWDGKQWILVDTFRVTGENEPILKITLCDGTEIKTTYYHKFMTDDDRVIEAKSLMVGERLKISNAPKSHGDISAAGSYLKGFLVGDGACSHSRPSLLLYDTKYQCQKRLIESALEIPEKNINTNVVRNVGFKDDFHGLKGNRRRMTGLSSRKEELVGWVTSFKNKLPKEIYRWDKRSKVEFVAGVFDADGSASDTVNGYMYQISSIHREWLLDFQILLKTIGVFSRLSLMKKAGLKDFNDGYGEYPSKDCWRLTISQSSSVKLSLQADFSRLISFKNKSLTYKIKSKFNKVTKIEACGISKKVYCATVPSTSSFALSCSIIARQCGEINLEDNEFCNLTISVARKHDTIEDLKRKVRLATIMGTIQSMATFFPGLNPKWKENCERDRLLGVDITGQMDSPEAQKAENLSLLREYAVATNKEYAKKLGINQSVSVTCNKPSGNSSVLLDTSMGIHARKAPYYLRRVTIGADSPVFKVLEENGVPAHPNRGASESDAISWVFSFPIQSPEGAITEDGRSALEQLHHWMLNKVYWTEHNPSCFSGDTKFISSEGLKRFDSCIEGERIRILNSAGKWGNAIVHKFNKQKIVELTLEKNGISHVIKTTKDHLWPVTHPVERYRKKNNKELKTIELVKIAGSSQYKLKTVLPAFKVDYDIEGIMHGLVFGDGTQRDSFCQIYLCDKKRPLACLFEDMGYKVIDRDDVNQTRIYSLPFAWKELPVNYSAEYLKGFIMGWIASDGSIDKKGNLSISNVKKESFVWLQEVACVAGFSVSTKITRNQGDTTYGKLDWYNITFAKGTLHPHDFIRRDQEKRYRASAYNKYWKIKSVNPTEQIGRVYCLEVLTEDELFVLEGDILTHNCTISYDKEEMPGIIDWLFVNQDKIGGLSFLPKSDIQFDWRLMPYWPVTKEEYEKHRDNFPTQIDYSRLYAYEFQDHTTATQELACTSGQCDV